MIFCLYQINKMITIYNGSGQVYQTILSTENDITYNDLIKYIKIPNNPKHKKIGVNLY